MKTDFKFELFASLGVVLIIALAYAACVGFGPKEYYPETLLADCSRLPISKAESANNIIAKIDIGRVQVFQLLDWYKRHGYTVYSDGAQTYGYYGPDGISFDISSASNNLTLVVKRWNDFD